MVESYLGEIKRRKPVSTVNVAIDGTIPLAYARRQPEPGHIFR